MIRFLSSVKFAVALITALIVSSILATLYPQVNVYSSFWFRGLLLLFTLNLSVCTFKRLPAIFKKIGKEPTVFFPENDGKPIILQDRMKSEESLKKYLKEKGYRIKEKSNGQVSILAQKGFLNLIAPHLLHLSLIIVLLGAFLGSFGSEGRVLGYVGQRAKVPADITQGMTIEVNNFQTVYDTQGTIDNWVSDITLYVDDKKVSDGTTKVNHPFKYKGIVFYQSSYGYNHLVEITGEQAGTYAIPDGRVFKLADQFFNIKQVRGGALIRVFKGHEVVQSKILKPGEKLNLIGNISLEYLEINPYTVLKVKRNPGTKVVMAGFLLMTITSVFFWTGRYREIRFDLNKEENKLYISVKCKNKEVQSNIREEITKRIQEE